MSFDTPHDPRCPPAQQEADGWINAWNMKRIRGKATKVMGFPSLVLTTVGAKSGTPRHTPVADFPDGADSRPIVASAAGAAKNPDSGTRPGPLTPTTCRSRSPGRPSRSAPNSSKALRRCSTRGATSPAPQNVSRTTSRKPTANCPSTPPANPLNAKP